MKKIINLFLISTFLLLISTENVSALTINTDNPIVVFGNAVCILFLIIGVVIIIYTKTGGKTYNDEEKQAIADLKVKEDKKKTQKKNDEMVTDFNPDSIFKILPTFSPNKFMNDTYEEIEKRITENKQVVDHKLLKKNITDFKDGENEYLITVKYLTEESTLDENGQLMKTQKYYSVNSECSKNKDVIIDTCPNCGGKIKDSTLLRCKYCNAILPKVEKETSDNTWTIKEVQIIDK